MTNVIQVDRLSKAYMISHHLVPSYGSLREEFVRAFRHPLGMLRGGGESREEIWALKDVSFEVSQGDIVGIIGKNGSGKSTLLKILSRVVDPSAGHAVLQGRTSSLLEVGTGFHPELTGRENVYLNGAILGMPRREIERKFDEIVAFAEVERFLDTPVKFYSSGMYVRLAFAVAAHLEPDILIVDEVLSVGDAQFQEKSLSKMKAVAREGRTVLFVSHNMQTTKELCRSLLWLEAGEVRDYGKLDSAVLRAYLTGQGLSLDATEWTNTDAPESQYFRAKRLAVVDKDRSPLRDASPTNSEMWVLIEGEVLEARRDLTIGYALFDDDDRILYWSYQTDVPDDQWPVLNKGPFTMRSRIPPRLLNEGKYRVELIASIHFKDWIFMPDVNAPFVYLTLAGGMSDSSYWLERRPGPIAPVLPWIVEQ
jgi:lipopolysaccharide transport system ATP-binding protein